VTTLRVRQTSKGRPGSASLTPAGLPNANSALRPNQRLGQPTLLREAAFLVAKGCVAHEETTGTKVWIDQIVTVSSTGAHMRALATAVEHLRSGLEVD
jgi:hypothetical protein